MAKLKFPVTVAIRFLQHHQIDYQAFLYPYQAHGGTLHSAKELNIAEHCVIKTIVFIADQKYPLIVLMHGDKEVSTKKLARWLNYKHIVMATPNQVTQLTGYQVGGCSPFGIKHSVVVYFEATILTLSYLYINGGKRGFLVKISPGALPLLGFQPVTIAIDKS